MSKDAMASTVEPFPEVDTRSSQRMIAWMFVLSLASGIILGCLYVVSRAADAPPPASPAVAARPSAAPALAPAPVSAPVPVNAPSQQAGFRILTAAELKGNQFLQVGVIDRPNVPAFVESLEQRGFHASGAEGTTEANLRILIGPLSGDSLVETMRRLQQAGFATFPTAY